MRFPLKKRLSVVAGAAFAVATGLSSSAFAQVPCEALEQGAQALYGAGGSAVTETLANIATALVKLPLEQRVKIFYDDPGACTGYQSLISPTGNLSYYTWDENRVRTECTAPASKVVFAHMGNTPLLCPGNQPLPVGFAKYVAPVQTINLITGFTSDENAISAEALYHIFGFGPGAEGRSVAPWSVVESQVYARNNTSFVHQILAATIGVPPSNFRIPQGLPINDGNTANTNQETVAAVLAAPTPDGALGYVSGSAADQAENDGHAKTLAYRHFDQTCAYLPDSTRARKDKLNVRTGQYYLWTPAWVYAKVNTAGEIVAQNGTTLAPLVKTFIGWLDGTLASPEGLELVRGGKTLRNITEIVIDSGDIPLCAMRAMRPEGDLSAIQSFAPDEPCNGYFEQIATGSTDYQACEETSECTGENEQCLFGFCEVTYPTSTN